MINAEKHKRIRVFGPCGSGKSYLTSKISKQLNLIHYETDNMIWNRKENIKYTRDKRNKNLKDIMSKESWLIEGAQYKWSFESFQEADLVIYIDPKPSRLYSRIISRFIKMQINPMDYNYKQSLKELFEMFIQTREYYKTTRDDFVGRIEAVSTEVLILNDSILKIK